MSSFDPDDQSAWPAGDSELAVLIRNRDWSRSSLGPIGGWPQSLRTLVDMCLSHPLPCAVACGPDRLLLYNDACAHLHGDAHPNALGAPAASAFPEAISDTGPVYERLLAGEAAIFRKRPWVSRRHGVLTTGHYDAIFTPVRNESGMFAYAFTLILDARVDSLALPAEAAPEPVIAPDALWILDVARMRLDYASPALNRLLGESRTMVQADFRRWLDLVHPDDRAAVDAHLSRSAAGEVLVAQYRIIRASDASIVSIRHTSFPMQNENGGSGQVVGLVQDITAIERTKAALLEEKERYRVLAEGMPPLVWRSSNEGLWTWAGPQWLDYTGQTQEQAQGWGWLDAIHPEDRKSTMEAWHQARPHGVLDATFRLRRASDQTWRWFQTRSLPRHAEPEPGEPDGPIVEWLGSSTDIDDLKRLQTRQAALISELEHRTESLKNVVRSLGGAVRGSAAG
jgi:PAS domain S-box-containing protein